MRVLVATDRTNGRLPGDYHYCVDGELVYMQDPCATDMQDPDGGCGCGRGFAGMNSHRATTTAMVVEAEFDRAQVREALRSSLEAGGWFDRRWCSQEMEDAFLDLALRRMTTIAEHFPLGSVVRRRIDHYTAEVA